MATTENESDIDKKKKNIQSGSPNWIEFLVEIIWSLVMLIIICFVNSRLIYACKVAQANILPTNINCMPYTNTMPTFDTMEPEVSIDVIKSYNKDSKEYDTYSTKLVFPINEEIFKNYIPDKLKKLSKNHNLWRITMYMIDVLNNLYSANYGIISFILNLINSTFEEWVILIFVMFICRSIGSLLGFVGTLFSFAYLFNMILTVIIFAVCSGRLFQYNSNTDQYDISDPASPPVWKKGSLFSLYTIFSISMAFILLWVFMFGGSFLIFLNCVFTPFAKTAKIVGSVGKDKDDARETYTWWKSFIGTLETKIDLLLGLFCVNTVLSTFSNIGIFAAFFVLVASIIFVYRSMYSKKTIPKFASSGLSLFTQYKKTCPDVNMDGSVKVNNTSIEQLESLKNNGIPTEQPLYSPLTGAVVEPPLTGAVVESPLTGAVVESPLTGAVVEQPLVPGSVVESPLTGAVVEPPFVVEPPSTGVVVKPPSTGAVVEPPLTGAVVESPLIGAVVEPPSTGAVVESPSTGAVVESPSTGPASTNAERLPETPLTETDRLARPNPPSIEPNDLKSANKTDSYNRQVGGRNKPSLLDKKIKKLSDTLKRRK